VPICGVNLLHGLRGHPPRRWASLTIVVCHGLLEERNVRHVFTRLLAKAPFGTRLPSLLVQQGESVVYAMEQFGTRQHPEHRRHVRAPHFRCESRRRQSPR
jgi:hypothetical protein